MHLFSDLTWACIAAESVWPHVIPTPLVDLSFPPTGGCPWCLHIYSFQIRKVEEGRKKAREGGSCAVKRLHPPEDALLHHSHDIWGPVPGNHPPVQ